MERTALGSFLRTSQAWCQQVSEKQTLDFGIVFFNRRFPSLAEANQIREVTLESVGALPDAVEQVNRFFSSKSLACLRWAPAINVDPKPLADCLSVQGFIEREFHIYRLKHWRDLEPDPSIRVLPARAMRNALADTFSSGEAQEEVDFRHGQVECALERLDDPQLDMLVALVDKRPAGRCGLYQVGDIARIVELTVLPSFSGRGVDRTLLAHVLVLAKRLAMPLVLTHTSAGDTGMRELLLEAGFVTDGRFVEFDARTAPGSPLS